MCLESKVAIHVTLISMARAAHLSDILCECMLTDSQVIKWVVPFVRNKWVVTRSQKVQWKYSLLFITSTSAIRKHTFTFPSFRGFASCCASQVVVDDDGLFLRPRGGLSNEGSHCGWVHSMVKLNTTCETSLLPLYYMA